MLTAFAALSKRYRLVLILLIALLQLSCSPMKRATGSKQSIRSNTAQRIISSQEDQQCLEVSRTTTQRTEATDQTDERVVTVTEVFDTTLPMDSVTGTPPLRSRTTEERQRISQANRNTVTEQQAQATAIANSSSSSESESTGNTDQLITTEQTEKRGLNDWQRTLCGVGILTLLCIAIKQALKHLKPL